MALVLVAGCASEGNGEASSSDEAAPTAAGEAGDTAAGGGGAAGGGAPEVTPAVATAAQLVGAGRAVIRTAEVSVEAEDVPGAARAAVAVAEAAGGFLADERSTLGDEPSATLVLKVLPERFGPALDDLAALGEVTSKQVGTDDVTEVVVDLEGRLAAARASVERLRELLGEAADVPQVVAVEAELARREGEVESLAGQLRALEAHVDLATITLELTTPAAATSPSVSEDIPGFLAGLRTGWVAFVNVLRGALTVAGFALPFAALAVVLGLPALWWHRRRAAPAT